ncbi:hypothetical protein [Georgenia subflava]|uniref:LemA family protein n=1 Tax=Georgenia subflava TaxID=1622177 RepID=A0A6N7EL24_9MICO|nr:hypothetical protein [Georgenia subflava]MPV37743.1 hypothetical protein [Georgenia subflava]
MGVTEWVLIAVAVLAVAVVVLWRQAVRVDRLHRTVLRSRATLEAQLAARAAAANELAATGALDPVEALLVTDVALRASDAAAGGLVADGLEGRPDGDPLGEEPPASRPGVDRAGVDRAVVESELSRTLRAVLGAEGQRADLAEDPRAADVLVRLEQAWYRLQLARRFHNARVVQVRRVRATPLVRLFHLAGHAPVPEPFDMDDAPPHD